MLGEPKIGVAITQWNRADLTAKLLENLTSASTLSYIAICDNGSSEVEVGSLKESISRLLGGSACRGSCNLSWIRNSVNSGFSRGMNIAIKELLETDVDWIWVLNNDVSINSLELKRLPSLLRDKKNGIYSTCMVEEPIGQFTGNFQYNFLTTKFRPIETAVELDEMPQAKRYVSGASMIVHREIFEKVGLLNDRTFLYFEELDFTFRARKKNFQQFHLGEGLSVEHLGAASSNSKAMEYVRIYNETWSTLDFYTNHCRGLMAVIFILRPIVRCFSLLMTHRYRLIKCVFSATKDYITGKHKYLCKPEIIEKKQFKL